VEPDALLECLRADGAALATAARLGLEAAVPGCPGWDVAELLRHIGSVHRWAADIVTDLPTEFPGWYDPQPPPGADLVEWYEEGFERLVGALSSADPEAPVWNFGTGRKVAAFWTRRQAHETSVHRWDAQSAHDAAAPVDADLAVDGVDEVFEVFAPRRAAGAPDVSLGGTLHVHCTDRPGEWLVSVEGGVAEVRREHGKGDCAVRGGASDLLLFLWNRVSLSSLEVFGDPSVAERWSQLRT
jgi:uncharacterized protein (TIGR03083 family)